MFSKFLKEKPFNYYVKFLYNTDFSATYVTLLKNWDHYFLYGVDTIKNKIKYV